MTLELRDVMKKVRAGSVRVTYEKLDIRIEERASVAFLAHAEAGVEGIVNLICGADAPDRGQIIRGHSISWPIPNSSFIQGHLSLAANARFLARLYEIDERAYLARIAETGLDKFLDTRVENVSGEIKGLFVFVAGVSLPFDRYIITKTTFGKKTFPDLADRLFEDLRQRAGLLLVTSNAKVAAQYCDEAFVFDQGTATFYDDMEAATEHFSSIQSKDAERDSEDDADDNADSDLENMVGLDF